jgi:hypothetical protein
MNHESIRLRVSLVLEYRREKRDWAAQAATCRFATIPARGVEDFWVLRPAIRCLANSCQHRDTLLLPLFGLGFVNHKVPGKVIYLMERRPIKASRMSFQSCETGVSASSADNWL